MEQEGGVGTFAVQIAKLCDVEVTGVDCTSKLDMLRSIGFDHIIDYTQEDFTKNLQCYDLSWMLRRIVPCSIIYVY